MKSHSTNVLTRYPLRRQSLIRACTASAERSGIDATGLPFAVHPNSTVAGINRLREVAALSRLLSGCIALPLVTWAALLHSSSLACARSCATAQLSFVRGGAL